MDFNSDQDARWTLEQLLEDGPIPWTVEDLQRELRIDRLMLDDALAGLLRAGLAHRHGDVVFASRAAVQFHRLVRGK
jgi:predicted transcriptional regulator